MKNTEERERKPSTQIFNQNQSIIACRFDFNGFTQYYMEPTLGAQEVRTVNFSLHKASSILVKRRSRGVTLYLGFIWFLVESVIWNTQDRRVNE